MEYKVAVIIPTLNEERHIAYCLDSVMEQTFPFNQMDVIVVDGGSGYVPDFDSRYFTEDFPFGLKIIHDLSHEKELFCPNIDKVYEWGMRMLKD